ncbi:MAG: histone deacetylase [Acidimicrobiia bacterium]|nr:histone deacetylase [Acidimicrobiia bacterium]
MRTLLVTHPVFYRHASEHWHPERPERLDAVIEGVRRARHELQEAAAPEIDLELIRAVHDAEYIRSIEAFCRSGGGHLDPDTYATPASWEAALRSAGAGVVAVDRLQAGAIDTAFLAIRPPGHHAVANQAMGFCLFNNVAIVARMLVGGGARVAIVDWDIHHGNGTQDMFDDDPSVLYVSFHQYPFYPGTGWLDETGYGPGRGTTVNIPLPALSGGDVYRAGYEQIVAPILAEFEPDWILISAGFDAHELDPLADGMLVASDYQFLSSKLAAAVPTGRMIYFLEGGYDLAAVRDSVTASLEGAAGFAVSPAEPNSSSPGAWRILELVRRAQSEFWML